MAFSFQDMIEEARLSARALIDYGEHFFNPTVRLGVTGLSRAGKTVFITALIHGLTRGGRFPVFEAYSSGRIARAHLAPQPDDAVPRFAYESHLRALIEERRWPNSTVDISELRLVIDYQRQNGADRTLTLDIVDYPGEWLLDLPLLQKSFEQWSAESLALSREAPRVHLAADWHAHLATLKPEAREDEQATLTAAKLFRGYLQGCRDERFAMSLLPPGRFLMPGNLADTPALTFAPLDVPAGGQAPEGSLWAMMVRRYEAYKDVVVRPFFRDHFARLDRQIVLADALAAFNAGPEALHDLEAALAGILDCFNIGRSTFLSGLFRPRIDRVLFAATKADHLHHSSHDRLERPCCAARSPAPLRARKIPVRRSTSSRSPPSAPRARRRSRMAVTNCRRSWERPPREKAPAANSSTAAPRWQPFRATCPWIPSRCSTAPTHSAASRPRPPGRAIFASCASVRRSSNVRGPTTRRCLTSASTVPCSS
ncbi:putative YcjX-like family ATPase [Bradyrhizobium sp. GM22.5]